MTEGTLEIASSQSDISAKNQGLSSPFYQGLLFLYIFFNVATSVASSVVGLTAYVAQWNLSYIFYINTAGFMFLALTVSEFIVSTYSDKSESKYGRRKPYVVIGYIISSVGTQNTKNLFEIVFIISRCNNRYIDGLHSARNFWDNSSGLVFNLVGNCCSGERHYLKSF